MPRPNPFRPFRPHPDQMALKPAVSGNAVNGLGERERRRPRMVYWAPDPDTIPHGAMQRWFYTNDGDNRDILAANAARKAVLAEPVPDVSGPPREREPEAWTAALQDFVEAGECERIGVAAMRAEWTFEGCDVPERTIIVIGVQHAYDAIAEAPEPRAGAEVIRQYGRAACAAKRIAGWLRQQGWPAEPVTGPMTGSVALIPPALACGFGELGKHGSIINPEFGASFRLSAVLTDAPFLPTPPRDFGIDDFCTKCRVCEEACPPEAIAPEKQTVRGETKWYVDFDKCLPFFNDTRGCAICIAVCPWSRPGAGLNLADKLERRRVRKAGEEAGHL